MSVPKAEKTSPGPVLPRIISILNRKTELFWTFACKEENQTFSEWKQVLLSKAGFLSLRSRDKDFVVPFNLLIKALRIMILPF